MYKKVLALTFVLILAFSVSALSPEEALNFVTKTNNFLLDNEQASIPAPQTTINYSGEEYWVVAGESSGINVYIPINDSEEKIADGEIEVRELIETTIIVENVYELKNNYPVGDWPFSRTNESNFNTLESKLNNKIPSYTIIETNLEGVDGTQELIAQAGEVKEDILSLAIKSKELAELIGEGINFEKDYFIDPDTNETNDYKKLFENYFELISEYNEYYSALNSEVSSLRNNIGSFPGDMSASEKEYYNAQAKLPSEMALLNSVFSRANETQTFIEEIFNSSNNVENFVLTLETRKERNAAWKKIYGFDSEINKLNAGLNSLADAAETILKEENVDYWIKQENVKALEINWGQAQEKYSKAIYKSAAGFADEAKDNAIMILEEGLADPEEVQIEGTLVYVIIILIVIIVGVFLFEKFYLNKKKEKVKGEEYYEEGY
jgi:regulator of replication initiation timing